MNSTKALTIMDLPEPFVQDLVSMRSLESCLVSVMTPPKLDDYSKKWAELVRSRSQKRINKMVMRWPNGGESVHRNLKKANDEQRVILYVDESACYLLSLLARTWAPCGQTPVLLEQAGRAHLSLIAAIAPNGRLHVAGQDQPSTSEDIVWFLNKLCGRYRKLDLLVIWDGAAIHRSAVVKNLLRAKAGRVHLERLPACSPELNPV